MDTSELSLRELKKQMTREAIADAALQLAREQGVDGITIEEIAQRAIISPRTFSNYFVAKEQAVVVAGMPPWHSVIERFRALPADRRPLDHLAELILDASRQLSGDELARDREVLTMATVHESLNPHLSAEYDALGDQLRIAIAERLGVNADTDLYSRLVASATVVALLASQRVWVAEADAGPERLVSLLREAFDVLGVAPPTPETP